MAALTHLIRASVFFLCANNQALGIAFRAYTHGLYGNLQDEQIAEAFNDATDWVQRHWGTFCGSPTARYQHYRNMAEAHVERAGNALHDGESENVDGFFDFVKVFGLDEIFEGRYRENGRWNRGSRS